MNTAMSCLIEPLDATFGAKITNVDLSQLGDETWQQIYAAFLQYGVLIFPAQHLSEETQGKFALRFGAVEQLSPKQTQATITFTNQRPDGSLLTPQDEGFRIAKGNEGWHTDSTYMPLASKAAMLAALTIPPDGGETDFADMRAAWDALDRKSQDYLQTLSAYHSLYHSQSLVGYTHKTDHYYGFHNKGAPLRPIVKVHPETGRKSIYTGRHAYGIPGLTDADSATLLQELLEQACQPPRTYRHVWQVGDIVVWDNRCMLHRARPYDASHARALRASRISGDPATELAPTFADQRASEFKPSTSNTSVLAK